MKKITLLLTLIFCITLGFSQNSKVVTAYNYQRQLKLDKAKEAIDAAVKNEKTIADAKAWFYRGNIYLDIAISPDTNYRNLCKDPLAVAYDSYKKAKEYDVKEKYTEDIDRYMPEIARGYYNAGVNHYNEEKYVEAAKDFENTFLVFRDLGKLDTSALYNAAVAASLGGDNDEAIRYYKMVMDYDYENADMYLTLGEIFKSKGDTLAALETFKNGREKYPDNFNLLISETNIYLAQNNIEKALENLELAIEKDNTNPTIFFAVGTNYDQLGMNDKAEAAYKSAIELDPDYFEANYNLGALYVNQAAVVIEEANDLPLDAVEKFDSLKADADDLLKKSLPYLEKALELQPDDTNTLISLKEIYTRLNMMDKLKVVNEKLGI